MAAEPHEGHGRRTAYRRLVPLAGLLAGGALLWWVIGRAGGMPWRRLGDAWPLLLAVVVWFVLPLYAASESWRALFTARHRPSPGFSLHLTWIGLGVNWLLPVAMVGGEVVKYRLARRQIAAPPLIASLFGDKTQQVITQLVFSVLGLALLGGLTTGKAELAGGAGAVAALAVAVYGFYRLQQSGALSAIAARLRHRLPADGSGRLLLLKSDAAIRALYRRRGAWWRALGWRLLFRALFAAEIAIALAWEGVDWNWREVLALESLAQGARAAAFVIPAGIGAQEGALIGAGLLFGLPGEALLVAAVLKRSRELIAGGAALIAWQIEEGRRWFTGSA